MLQDSRTKGKRFIMEKFLDRLSELMGGRNASEFARFLGVKQRMFDYAVKGERKPSVELVIAICTKTGCSFEWLFGLTEDMPTGKDGKAQRGCSTCRKQAAIIRKQSEILERLSKGINSQSALLDVCTDEIDTVNSLILGLARKQK